jgi:hypothetical protein
MGENEENTALKQTNSQIIYVEGTYVERNQHNYQAGLKYYGLQRIFSFFLNYLAVLNFQILDCIIQGQP